MAGMRLDYKKKLEIKSVFMSGVLLLASCAAPQQVVSLDKSPPRWTKTGQHIKYPDTFYLTATGEGEKMELADKTAMVRIGEQIQISIKSEFSLLKEESARRGEVVSREDVSLLIETSVDIKELEGISIVERYFDEKLNIHYSLAALDREKAAAALLKDINYSYGLAGKFYSTAENHRDNIEAAQAIHNYVRAIEEYKKGRPKEGILSVISNELVDKKIIDVPSLSDMEGRLIDVVSRCRLEVLSGDKQRGVFGKKLKEPLVVRAIINEGGKYYAIQGLPVKFSVIKGSATIQEEVTTDEDGMARSVVSRVNPSGIKNNLIDATLNFPEVSASLTGLSARFTYILPIKEDVRVAVDIVETNFGERLLPPVIGPMIVKALKESGFNVVTSYDRKKNEVDFVIKGEIGSSKKGELGKVIFAHSTGALRIFDSKTGNIVKEITVDPDTSKGGGVTEETAGLNALKSAASIAGKEVAASMEKIFNENYQGP